MSKSRVKQLGRKKNQNAGSPSMATNSRPNFGRPPGWLLLLVIFAVVGLSTYFFCERFLFVRVPLAIAGKWGVEGGPQDGATLHFHRNGAFTATVNVQGKEGVIQARVEVVDERIHIFSANPHTGKEEVQTHLIKSLTAEEMVPPGPERYAV
jgi:hypothetical protein